MVDNNDSLPQLSVDLIEELDKIYPEKSPDKGESYADIMFKAGQRSVVRNLKVRLRQSEEDELTNRMKGE